MKQLEYQHIYLFFSNDYFKYYIANSELQPEVIHISSCIKENINSFFYILFRIHHSERLNRLFKIPLKRIWVGAFFDSFLKSLMGMPVKLCFHFIGFDLKRFQEYNIGLYIRKHYPASKILFYFSDKVDKYFDWFKSFSVQKIKKQFDIVITYNEIDSLRYQLQLHPPVISNFPNVVPDSETEDFDVFFIGRSKGRFEEIIKIAEVCKELRLSIRFYLLDVPKEKRKKIDGVYYLDNYISYEKCLSVQQRAKAILNYVQKGVNGLTLRDYEAIGMNKVLITNGKYIFMSPLYNKNKVIFVDNLRQEVIKIKNQSPDELWNNSSDYSLTRFYRWVESHF